MQKYSLFITYCNLRLQLAKAASIFLYFSPLAVVGTFMNFSSKPFVFSFILKVHMVALGSKK